MHDVLVLVDSVFGGHVDIVKFEVMLNWYFGEYEANFIS